MSNLDPALTLEQRVADLEALLAPLIEPRATVPPITIGELTDVPTVGSSIASQWAQEVSNRAIHRFATKTLLDGWAAADGSFGYVSGEHRWYMRDGGAWTRTGWGTVAGRTIFDASATVGAAIGQGSLVPIVWTTETTDSDGFGAGGSAITIPAGLGGLYLASLAVTLAATGATAFVRLSATGSNAADVPFTNTGLTAAVSMVFPIAAGGNVTGQIFHTAGGNTTITSASMRLVRLGP